MNYICVYTSLLAWKVGFPTWTSCTAGGICPRHTLANPHCDIKYLVEDVLAYVKYVKSMPSGDQKRVGKRTVEGVKRGVGLLPFVVTGALNVKTVLANGMPTQFRRGSAWNDVMWFVGIFALHYLYIFFFSSSYVLLSSPSTYPSPPKTISPCVVSLCHVSCVYHD